MFSDIYGEDKKEKYLIIRNLLRDKGCIGVIYGKKGVGKKYLVRKVIEEIKKDEDIVLFIDAQENWHYVILSELGIYERISKEEFLIKFFEFLQKFKGRVFIIFNNSHLLSDKQFLQIVKILGIKDKVSLIFIGEESIKQLLNPSKAGKISPLLNFIFEIKPPEFEEFYRFFKDKYGNKLSRKKVKHLFKLSGGSISEGISILEEGKSLRRKNMFKLLYYLSVFTIVAIIFIVFYGNEKREEKKVAIKDMKLPVEGSVEDSLPVKIKRKKEFELKEREIEKNLKKIYNQEIPPLKFYEKKRSYKLQIATFKSLKNAENLREKLLQTGLDSSVEHKNGLHRVIVYTSNRNELEKVLKSLKEMGFKPIVKKVR